MLLGKVYVADQCLPFQWIASEVEPPLEWARSHTFPGPETLTELKVSPPLAGGVGILRQDRPFQFNASGRTVCLICTEPTTQMSLGEAAEMAFRSALPSHARFQALKTPPDEYAR